MATKKPAPAPKQKSWSDYTVQEKAGIVVAVIIVLFLLITLKGLIFGGSDNKTSNDSKECTSSLVGLSEDDQIKTIVTDAATKCDGFADAVREVRVIPELDGSKTVNVKFYVESLFEKRYLDQTMGVIYTALYTSDKNVGAVTLMATTDLIDSYGNDAEGIIYQTTIDKETAAKVNPSQDKAVLEMQVFPDLWTVQKQHKDVK